MKASTTTQVPLRLFRADISPYQARDFAAKEKAAIEKCGHIWCDQLSQANVLITNTHTKLARFTQNELAQLELIIHPNSGYDNFAVAEIQKLHCPIILGNPIRAKAVASYVMASLFHALGMPRYTKTWDETRQWPRRAIESLKIQIIGYGHIARLLEKSLKPFAQSISIYDPYKDKNELNFNAHVIVMACSLNPNNQLMINQDFLSQCRDDLIFINPARGKLVNTDHLKEWLTKNERALAYLDVFEDEPYELSDLPINLKATSHIAGVDEDLDQRIIDFVCSVCLDYSNLSKQCFTDKWDDVILAHRVRQGQFI